MCSFLRVLRISLDERVDGFFDGRLFACVPKGTGDVVLAGSPYVWSRRGDGLAIDCVLMNLMVYIEIPLLRVCVARNEV